MIYKKYGTTFKNMRKDSKFKLTDFKSIGIAPSTLSEFERGKTMIGLEKIDAALQLIGSSLSEYDNFLNHYTSTNSLDIFHDVEEAVIHNDLNKLNQIYKICQHTDQKIICLSIKILLGKAKTEEKDDLVSFLYDVKNWGGKELYIFYILIEHISPKDILNILKELNTKGEGMYASPKYNRGLVIVLCEAILALSHYGYKSEAKNIINLIENKHLTQNPFLNDIFYATKGFWIYYFEDKENGHRIIKNFFKMRHLIDQPATTKFFHEKYLKYIDTNDSINLTTLSYL